MPRPSMPPRRLITTRTLPPEVAPKAVCRTASPNIVVATAPAPEAATPWRNRRRERFAARSKSAQLRCSLVIGATSASHVGRRVEEDRHQSDEEPVGDRVVAGDDRAGTAVGGL